jgi:hypothetical protein
VDDAAHQTRKQQERGCHGPAIAPCNLDGDDLDRCPVRLVQWAAVRPVLNVWPHLEAGRFPLAGGYAEQPALFLDVLEEVDRFTREREAA